MTAMPDKFDPETTPPEGWRVAETRQNGAIFKLEETGCELLVLQIKGPGKTQGGSSEAYVLRYFEAGNRNTYVDLATTTTKAEMREITREVMKEIKAENGDSRDNEPSLTSECAN